MKPTQPKQSILHISHNKHTIFPITLGQEAGQLNENIFHSKIDSDGARHWIQYLVKIRHQLFYSWSLTMKQCEMSLLC